MAYEMKNVINHAEMRMRSAILGATAIFCVVASANAEPSITINADGAHIVGPIVIKSEDGCQLEIDSRGVWNINRNCVSISGLRIFDSTRRPHRHPL